MRFDVLTLHPEMVRPMLTLSVLGRAVADGTITVEVHDIRSHAEGRHRQCDDAPYGGGPGMVMKVDVVARAIDAVRVAGGRVLLMTPGGRPFRQADARRLARERQVVLVCGHYEGIDARIEALVDEEISLGDFVLTGGEIPAAAVVDAVARLVPGVLGNSASPEEESHGSSGLLEYPQYTRPAEFRGESVPAVLLSGHHARIEAWRREEAERRTRQRRPDLWEEYVRRVDGDGNGQ